MASLFSKPKAPDVPKPVPMPDMELVERDKRRNMARQRRTGRVSTILSDPMG